MHSSDPKDEPSCVGIFKQNFHYLEWQSEGLVSWSCWRNDGVKSLEEGGAVSLAFLPLHVPSLVPTHVVAGLQHVVAVPSGDGDEWDSRWVVADLLDKPRHFLLDLLKPGLAVGWLGGIHLVDGHDQLLHSQGVSQQGVLSGLSVLGDTSFELSGTGGDDQNTAISLKQHLLLKQQMLFLSNEYVVVRVKG